jgi:hypothetical protein
MDGEIGQAERTCADGSFASLGGEGEYMRTEFTVGYVEGEPAVALEHDHRDVEFAIGVRLDGRSRIEVNEVDVEVVACLEAPVDAVSVRIGAEYLVERDDGRQRDRVSAFMVVLRGRGRDGRLGTRCGVVRGQRCGGQGVLPLVSGSVVWLVNDHNRVGGGYE